MTRKRGQLVTELGILWLACCTAIAQIPDSAEQIDFRITAPTMVAALLQFSDQAGLQLVFPMDGDRDIAAPKVIGLLTPRAALEQLLRDSGLKFHFVNYRTVSISLRREEQVQENVAAMPAK